MKFTTTFLMTLLIVSAVASISNAAVTVPRSVDSVVQHTAASSYIDVLLSFEDDLDISAVKMSRLREKRSRIDTYYDVMHRLEKNRKSLESSISPILNKMKKAHQVESYRFFTVSKTVLVRTKAGNVENLLALPGVELINLNSKVSLIEPVKSSSVQRSSALATSSNDLQAINVPALWAKGYTGTGSVICSFDTGVDGDHPALSSKWRGNNGGPASNYWFAPRGDSLPYDKIGHGSHTMGIMVGSTDTDTIGVAPGAEWISAAVVDQGADFSTTIADILAAFEWALNPDGDINTTDDIPDVINNSWGVPTSIYSDCNNTFWTAIDNVEAAGIVTIFAAGNEGPDPSTIRNPADRASSPLNALSVGAIDASTLIVANFSSRGPSDCNGAIKPELVAPGVDIYSSYKDGGYKVMSGTSMAAPFISGLVALMRQYNPDATVEEIKNALIQATRDLGPTGEDNSYGHGLIDASRVLDYLPAPTVPQVFVDNYQINAGGDTIADPGEQVDLTITLHDPSMSINAVDVWLSTESSPIVVMGETQHITFPTNSEYVTSPAPFALQVTPDAISGSVAQIQVNIQIPGSSTYDPRTIQIQIGHAVPGQIFTSTGGNIVFSASEFGQFGFGSGSIYPAGGDGFRFNGSVNLLYEGGLITGRSPQMVSDGIRDDQGLFKETDFIPDENNTIDAIASSDEAVVAGFSDGKATLPIPININQKIWSSDNNFTILEYDISNPTAERLDNLSVGLFFDFDINRFHDRVGFDSLMGLLYQYNAEENTYVGIIGLSVGDFNFIAGCNDSEKVGFSTQDKYAMVNSFGITIADADTADWYFVASQVPGMIDAFAHTTVAVAIVAASNLSELRQAAEAAISEYGSYLDVEEAIASLPTEIDLSQNYPNPFNPQTTIEFTLKSSQNVSLEIYNVTGQKVKTLLNDYMQAGINQVVWDGRDENGEATASGIYFYRLTAENGESCTKKMILLK